jgi:LacI family transcriptional regulator
VRRKITLKDIARELEVSISTVSKALKNSEEIGRDTKEKVQAFAKLYNYKPNNIAISLKNKHTRNIGVIIPDIVHHFFTTVFRGIEKYANSRGYNVIVCVSDDSFNKEVINMEMLANGSIDGFILSLADETLEKGDFTHLKQIREQGIPLVCFDRTTAEVECDKVIINDTDISYEVVTKLIKDKRKRIGLVTNIGFGDVSNKRAKGYKKALLENNLIYDENLVLRLAYHDVNEQQISEFFKTQNVDAVLCVNEIFAMHCMGMAQTLGFSVPEDIAFVGFSDGILSKFSKPPLTAVAQHGDQMGQTAAEILIGKIEAEMDEEDIETYRTEIIQATLIERGSTRN